MKWPNVKGSSGVGFTNNWDQDVPEPKMEKVMEFQDENSEIQNFLSKFFIRRLI